MLKATAVFVAFAAMIKDRSNPGGVSAVVRGRWKLIASGGAVELYDIYQDPNERNSVALSQPIMARDLKLLLDAKLEAARVSPFE